MMARLTRGLEKTEKYGRISKIELPNKSKIYITKKGWNLVTPKGVEVNIPYSEISLAIDETIQQGYVEVVPMICEVCGKDCKKWFYKDGKKVCGKCFRR